MKPVNRGRSAWTRTGAILTLLACGLAPPSVARAGCGSYVVVGSHGPRGTASFDPLTLGGPSSHPEGRMPLDPTGRPMPCSGALCSSHPGIPVTPASTPPDRIEIWAWLCPRPSHACLDSIRSPSDEDGLHPSHCDLFIFRPPRPLLAASMA